MKFNKRSSSRVDQQRELASLRLLCEAFAEAMYDRLKAKFNEGYRGWDAPYWTVEEIIRSIQQEADLGDPIDAANYCAFMWNIMGDNNDK